MEKIIGHILKDKYNEVTKYPTCYSVKVLLRESDDLYSYVGVTVNDEPIEDKIEEIKTECLEFIRGIVLNNLDKYDHSINVNSFYIGETTTWIDKATRVGLVNSTQMEKASGLETTTVWFNGVPVEISCDKVLQMLQAIEVYAKACYNSTEMHRANINNLDNIQEIYSYDFTVGYPEKLSFEI